MLDEPRYCRDCKWRAVDDASEFRPRGICNEPRNSYSAVGADADGKSPVTGEAMEPIVLDMDGQRSCGFLGWECCGPGGKWFEPIVPTGGFV